MDSNRLEPIPHIIGVALRFGGSLAVLMFGIVLFFPHQLLSLLSNSPTVIAEGEKYFQIICFTIEHTEEDIDGLNYLAGQTVQYVNQKAYEGTLIAHMDGGTPNIILEIDRTDAWHFGYLVYFFEKACGISGYLLGVNPFNQPGVEDYKKNMFALLGRSGFEERRKYLEARVKLED